MGRRKLGTEKQGSNQSDFAPVAHDDDRGLGDPPKPLGPDGMELWEHLDQVSRDTGALIEQDGFALWILCKRYDRMCKAQEELDRTESTGAPYQSPDGSKAHPLFSSVTSLENAVWAALDKVYLTPGARRSFLPENKDKGSLTRQNEKMRDDLEADEEVDEFNE